MNKFILIAILALGATAPAMAASKGDSSDPVHIINTAPLTNRTTFSIFAGAPASTASVSAVTCSSSAATAVDTAFNAVALAALGADYQRAGILVQNKDTEAIECGYSPGLTIGNGWEITPGGAWTFDEGKNITIYCIAAAGSTANLRVGGFAWKR